MKVKRLDKTELLTARAQAQTTVEDAYRECERIIVRRGWRHTCQTPGSVWLWTKKLKDGRIILCNLELAIDIEILETGEHWEHEDE